ncbi:uncharacterized protein LOC130905535 [Corythoichthys intestinalis]|uniref:uncharacterized protein LOC130905535 n=1 Tax=Corythoichthys intestinalis TaxID=161448 RepID=UPI0025A4DE9A|nr:uncharacterized protein LOC130905535 [Corythoichthys intestinalis]
MTSAVERFQAALALSPMEEETFSSDSGSSLEFSNIIGDPEEVCAIQPYRFEPYLEEKDMESESSDTDETEPNSQDDHSRLGNTAWCSCECCAVMPTVGECVCCGEQERVREKMEGAGVQCITQHPGFQPVCLNVDVLQTAYYAYRQNYEDQSGNNWKRYTAYRQFVRWVYEFLGRRIRVPLPACVVAQIRTSFPSPEFVGYQPCNPP